MIYTNPIVKGFYPDPSVCSANGKYYLACSSFQFFPGVPLFESSDLVNWTQIGHVLTRKSQVMLDNVNSSGGVFAPMICFNEGRFYMTTNNNTTQQNFYVYTDDIYGEWSEPVYVEQDGIDPSLFFEDGKAYFMTNGHDDNGVEGIVQCEIDINTGKKLSKSKAIWHGTGGRYLEGPHMYKINNSYYIMAAEGGTEYGHMIVYAKGNSVWGEFNNYPENPVLTNRDKAPYTIQGIGHGDLVKDKYGNWHMISLGFRQIDIWQPYHHLGREVFLTPVHFDADGWFSAGDDGTTKESYEIQGNFTQNIKNLYTFENTEWNKDWCFIRHPHAENYDFYNNRVILRGTDITLEDVASPTFIGIRQKDFSGEISCKVKTNGGEAGISLFMCENEHYDISIITDDKGTAAALKLNIGDIKHIQNTYALSDNEINSLTLIIRMNRLDYSFYVKCGDSEHFLGRAKTKYLSSEVSSGFTGVVIGLYAIGNNEAEFTEFNCEYSDNR